MKRRFATKLFVLWTAVEGSRCYHRQRILPTNDIHMLDWDGSLDAVMTHNICATLWPAIRDVFTTYIRNETADIVGKLDLDPCQHYPPSDLLAKSAWQHIFKHDAIIRQIVSSHSDNIREEDLDEVFMMKTLIYWLCDMDEVVQIGQQFYLWSLSELLDEIPYSTVRDELKIRLDNAMNQPQHREVFASIPIESGSALEPITGKIGMRGGQAALNDMIAQYAARLPTREEVIERLLD